MSQLSKSTAWRVELSLAIVLALLSCCVNSGGPSPGEHGNAVRKNTVKRDAALGAVTPIASAKKDAAPPARVYRDATVAVALSRDAALQPQNVGDGTPSVGRDPRWPAELASRVRHMSQPFFVKRRGAGYRKPTTKNCLSREAGLLNDIDPNNISGISVFNWNMVRIIYRHSGSVKKDKRAAKKLAASLGGCISVVPSAIEKYLMHKRNMEDLIRGLSHLSPTVSGRMKVRVPKGSSIKYRKISIGRPLKEMRARWRKTIAMYSRTIREIRTTPCMAGDYYIQLRFRDKARCQATARLAAKDRRVRYAICCPPNMFLNNTPPCTK